MKKQLFKQRWISSRVKNVYGGKMNSCSRSTFIKSKLFDGKIVFVGLEIVSKEEIVGPHIASYFILKELKRVNENLFSFDTRKITIQKVINLFLSDCIWLIYPTRRKVGFLIALATVLLRKELILFINDLPILQNRDLTLRKKNTVYNIMTGILERCIFSTANVVISTSPYFFEYMRLTTDNRIVFPPGVCIEDWSTSSFKKDNKDGTSILLYAGSLDRGGMITKLSNMFNNIENWHFWIAGEGHEKINESRNVKYFGLLPKIKLRELYEKADAIIIPYPDLEYYNIVMPLKTGEIIASGKPIITLRLKGIESYIKFIGINNNIIFVDDWSEFELLKALKKAKLMKHEKKVVFHEKLLDYTWENRTKRLINTLDKSEIKPDTVMWI